MNKPTPKKGRTKLPDWDCSTDVNVRAMTDWVNARLDELETQQRRWIAAGERTERDNWDPNDLDAYIDAVRRARNGDMEPLRQMYPHLVEFLKRPNTGKRGNPKDRVIGPVRQAAIDVKIIRTLLWKQFPKRPRGIKAEQIAADRHKIDYDEKLINKLRKL
jgi:hypothetical protein